MMEKYTAKIVLAVLLTATTTLATLPVEEFAGSQVDLCMIGDSITWANNGDYFRFYLLDHMPQLAFIGTHTAKLGYSHAGEGGNKTSDVIARLNDIPDSRYYHLLLGVNDNAAAKSEDQVPAVAQGTANALVQIVHELVARPCTEKVFLGSLLPCGDDLDPTSMVNEFRDMANIEVNNILRAGFDEFFPSGKVVWVEYENELRPRDDWRTIIRLHPTQAGYAVIAEILAGVLAQETVPTESVPEDPSLAMQYGVEVVNLWNAGIQASEPLIPGWYTVSFKVDESDSNDLQVAAESLNPETLNLPLRQTFTIQNAVPGTRSEFMLYTGTEGSTYNISSIAIEPVNGNISDLLVEKMRPSQDASIYGAGTYIDTSSPISLGEKVILLPGGRSGAMVMNYDFNSHTNGLLATGFAFYDYTRNALWDNQLDGPNTLAFNTLSATTGYFIQDRGVGHEKCLYLSGAVNVPYQNTGFYLLDLDMTAGGANATQTVRVQWSFDILGTSNDADMITTNWTVTVNYGNTSGNISVSDGYFATNNSVVAQTFDFVQAGGGGMFGWTTVTGYLDIDPGLAGNLGGIQIRGHDGGWVSAGSGAFCLDNITVDISPISPATIRFAATNGSVRLVAGNLSGLSTITNILQATTNLMSGTWTNLYCVTGMTETNWTLPTEAGQRFYRIITTH